MADPLSIAGSVVGITAAGIQASVKLYALAEKVATASERVTSIADDISSTCAILNQVRELIIPQPDAHGTLRSVFNTVALNDISHALRRCRSSFTEIETLLRRAFEQVGKRPALLSKIKLSRYEQAKWPFLRPQFDEMRNDLRDAKGNLVLMIAVASLALAQRDGRQRPIHETERLEFTSTIVQLRQARPIPSHHRDTPQASRDGLQDRSNVAIGNTDIELGNIMGSGPSRSISRRSVPRYGSEDSTNTTPLISGPVALSVSAHADRTLKLSDSQGTSTFADASGQSIDDSVSEEQTVADRSSARTHTTAEDIDIPSAERRDSGLARNVSTSKVNTLFRSTASMSHPSPPPPPGNLSPPWLISHIFAPPLEYPPPPSPPSPPPTSSVLPQPPVARLPRFVPRVKPSCYAVYTSNHAQGLATGWGKCLLLDRMDLPDQSLERLIKTYTDEGQDVHIAMSELTLEQQALIKETFPPRHTVKVEYLRLQRNITVSSVFGMLNIETLKWIITSDTPFVSTVGVQVHHPVQASPLRPSNANTWKNPLSGPPLPRHLYSAVDDPNNERIYYSEDSESEPEYNPDDTPSVDSSSSDITRHFQEARERRAQDLGDLSDSETFGIRADVSPARLPSRRVGYGQGTILPVHKDEEPQLTLADHEKADSSWATATLVAPPRRGDVEAPSQSTEENGEDIVNELLARWTVS